MELTRRLFATLPGLFLLGKGLGAKPTPVPLPPLSIVKKKTALGEKPQPILGNTVAVNVEHKGKLLIELLRDNVVVEQAVFRGDGTRQWWLVNSKIAFDQTRITSLDGPVRFFGMSLLPEPEALKLRYTG